MTHLLKAVATVALLASFSFASDEQHVFSNTEGKTLEDRIVKYDFEEKVVTLEKNGKIPIDTFSPEDQEHILRWNQVAGFKSSMRFKLELKKSNWARMKHEQNVTPYFMDAIQIPGKRTPNHHVMMLEDYEEYNAVYLEAEGFEITLRNQNFFPLENLVVESKVFFEQEQYILPDSLFVSSESEYYDTVLTNKIRSLTETIPIIIPREEVVLYSESAVIVDHQVERNALITASEDEEGGDAEGEEDNAAEEMEGFGDWDDHGRRRKGRVTGVWFRVGVKDTNGEMVWRDISSPSSLIDKWDSWDVAGLPEPEDD